MAKRAKAKTDIEYAIAIVESGPNALLTRPEAVALVLRGINLGRELATTKVTKGPGEPDGDHE